MADQSFGGSQLTVSGKGRMTLVFWRIYLGLLLKW